MEMRSLTSFVLHSSRPLLLEVVFACCPRKSPGDILFKRASLKPIILGINHRSRCHRLTSALASCGVQGSSTIPLLVPQPIQLNWVSGADKVCSTRGTPTSSLLTCPTVVDYCNVTPLRLEERSSPCIQRVVARYEQLSNVR